MKQLEYDYVIVGAGSAGCVLANRLSESGASVCIVEAGGSDRRFWVQTPLGYGMTYADPDVNWMYQSDPSPELDGRSSYWPRGKVLGGSGSINAMVYIRGLADDYNEWADVVGDQRWSWNNVLPTFQKMETYSHAPSPLRGAGGPLPVANVADQYHPLCNEFISAAAELDVPYNSDFNGPSLFGVGHYQLTARKGLRASAAKAFLRPALNRANLTLLTGRLVEKVLFDGLRACGVRTQQGDISARREVIVAAGSVNSPQLLELSGVGDSQLLKLEGIELVCDNPNVGRHLQDHLALTYYYESNTPTLNQTLRPWWGKLAAGAQYLLTRTGPLAIGVNQAGGFIALGDEARASNMMQLYFSPLTYSASDELNGKAVQPDAFPGFLLSVSQCRVDSRGEIHIRSADPSEPPTITPNYLSAASDQKDLIQGARYLQALEGTKALSAVIARKTNPAHNFASDEQILADIKARSDTVYHPTSTCRMGRSAVDSVVDSECRVHGVEGLRVIDASVMPFVLSGNINAATMMLAYKMSGCIS